MGLSRRGRFRRAWADFQEAIGDLSGFSVQVFESPGEAVWTGAHLPPLCSYLGRHPEARLACQGDCFRKAGAWGGSRVLAGRCHAGLSFRVVPIRRQGATQATILVGRVLTEVSGGEQLADFIERYRLDRDALLQSIGKTRNCSERELDRAAAFVRRMALGFAATERRLDAHLRLPRLHRGLVEAAGEHEGDEPDPRRIRGLVEYVGGVFGARGVAVVTAGDDGRPAVSASTGLNERELSALAACDWDGVVRSHGSRDRVVLADRKEMLRADLDLPWPALTVQRLPKEAGVPGHVVLAGAAPAGGKQGFLEMAAGFIACRLARERCREAVHRVELESRLLGRLVECCLTAHSVEEVLPLALEVAMQSVGARRGSILLAGDEGRVQAHALRGDHAALSGTIEAIRPGTVSHRVLDAQRPLLVTDVEREALGGGERQFPYASRSFISVPLPANGRALGVLHVTERHGGAAFTTLDLELLERLGRQAALAIRAARLEEEVRELRVSSTTDSLTGLHNRRFLDERLLHEVRRSERFGHPLAVVMLDLDGFKHLNDLRGHGFGDRVLRQAADSIAGQLRAVDLVARYGGDEFVLLLPETEPEGAARTVARIQAALGGLAFPAGPGGEPCGVSASAGVAVYPQTPAAELIHRADTELLEAKRSRRSNDC